MEQCYDRHQATVSQVSDLFEQLQESQSVSSETLQNLSHEAVKQAAEDLDLFTCLGINPVADNTFFAHSTNVATLAIAVGRPWFG